MNFLIAGLNAWTCEYMRENKDGYDPVAFKLLYFLNWIGGCINIIIGVAELYEN